jgi:predicted nucleotidyltransferase
LADRLEKPMSLSEGQLAALSELEQLWPDAEAVVIGATALGCYYDMSWRHTTDVDLVVALTVDVLPALASRPGWSRHPKREYEFTSPGGARVDLIPASPDLLRAGRLQWLNGTVMSLVGMDLAFNHAVRHHDGVLVAPPAVVAILKMVAFGDRPAERERDLVDIGHLLDAYVKEDDERRWGETPEAIEFDLAPAFLLGVDIARLLSHDEHRRRRFLSQSGRSAQFLGSSHDAQRRTATLAH